MDSFRVTLCDWVHKSFYPDNILLFRDRNGLFDWSSLYLVGFDASRRNSGISQECLHDAFRLSKLYTHPSRQLEFYQSYKNQYIYSLGVVLLEIGRDFQEIVLSCLTERFSGSYDHIILSQFRREVCERLDGIKIS